MSDAIFKMIKRAILVLLLVTISQCFGYAAKPCNPIECRLPDCRCSGTDIPGNIPAKDTPQFVTITFDDAVTFLNNEYYQKAFPNRLNPDSCPVAATYYISHEYTDYSLVSKVFEMRQNFDENQYRTYRCTNSIVKVTKSPYIPLHISRRLNIGKSFPYQI